MAAAWEHQTKDAQIGSLGFDERFPLLVDAEHLARDNRRLTRLSKEADLQLPNACLEDVDTTTTRGLEKATLRQLGRCSWIAEHHNVLLCGPTGVGKSYLACALGQMACRRGRKLLYRRMARLLEGLALEPREPTPDSSPSSRRPNCCCSMISASERSKRPSATTCSRS